MNLVYRELAQPSSGLAAAVLQTELAASNVLPLVSL